MDRSIPPVHDLPRDTATNADTVSTYQLTAGPQAGMTVVEIFNNHRTVIARTIVDAPGTREDAADLVLSRSPIERCAGWAIDPIGRGKRSAAMVILRPSTRQGTLDTIRSNHEMSA